jgi:hypothetical protein
VRDLPSSWDDRERVVKLGGLLGGEGGVRVFKALGLTHCVFAGQGGAGLWAVHCCGRPLAGVLTEKVRS